MPVNNLNATNVENIRQWNKERGLLKNELGLWEDETAMLLEELHEYIIAVDNFDIFGMVDAVCDIVVLYVGLEHKCKKVGYYSPISGKLADVSPAVLLAVAIAETADKVIHALRFDFNKCMAEVIKEISSREGELNTETGKWTKKQHQTTYKANFELCRVN